ncbi:MAG: phospho-sugar mutase, partial [Actinobacteria bacterium]|nr:phospho-sugar mutase [Actinomycetota bacterium]
MPHWQSMYAGLSSKVAEWAAADPDPTNGLELLQTLRTDPSLVSSWFNAPLRFGTAGLRGRMGLGPARMNRVVVRSAAWAIGELLLSDGSRSPEVVIGYDARHQSREFALDSARVLVGLGVEATLIDGPIPTPVLAHEALSRSADAAIMVTASHNPPGDNGYKVYWSDSAQIRPFVATQIEEKMRQHLVPESDLAAHDWIQRFDPATAVSRYVLESVDPSVNAGAGDLDVTYTALHGVGTATLVEAFARAGLPQPHMVASQVEPDPDFSTVRLPNPEEESSLDHAKQAAAESGSKLILAHDPDADRLGVLVSVSTGWRRLSGDEIATLLADELLTRYNKRDPTKPALVARSLASSPQLDAIAKGHGAAVRRTATGFKWIIRAAIDEPDFEYVFGYEEALGFACSTAVRDKDGITAAVEIVRIARRLGDSGLTLAERLEELATKYGHFATGQVSRRYDDSPDVLKALLAVWR